MAYKLHKIFLVLTFAIALVSTIGANETPEEQTQIEVSHNED